MTTKKTIVMCDDSTCTATVHWYSPELSSVFTHKVMTKTNGEEEWVPVKAILKLEGPPRKWFEPDDPFDRWHYEVQWNCRPEEHGRVEYVEK